MVTQGQRDQRAQVEGECNKQRLSYRYPYYSTLHFATVRTGAGPYVYTLAGQADRVAFSYTVGSDMTQAGFSTTYGKNTGKATLLETSLTGTKFKPNGGHTVWIEGFRIHVVPISSPLLVAHILSKSHVTAQWNGTELQHRLGLPISYPGGVGLVGANQENAFSIQSLAGAHDPVGILSNGLAGRDNFFRFDEPLVWNETGTDSEFQVLWRLEQDTAFTMAAVTAAAGVQGYTPPADAAEGTWAQFVITLEATVNRKRSLVL